MTRAAEFSGIVTAGKLPSHLSQSIRAIMTRMEGKRITVKITEEKRPRSNPQNRFYWGVVVNLVMQMFHEAGSTVVPDDVHDFLSEHVGGLKQIVTDPKGVPYVIRKSTTELSTIEFGEYLERVRAWAAQFGLQIPLPNEDFYQQGEPHDATRNHD